MAVDRNELILQFKYQAGRANRGIDETNRKIGGLRLSTSGLRRSVGALRNNLLLVSFAFGAVATSMTKLISASTRFESIRTRLVGLTGSVENAQEAFQNFNEVAATTPFSLEDVVNAGAQLKAFGADANALIKPITDLAAFMGTTAVEAANSFGRAFAGGAGAADILRERGILNIIKSSQGIEDLSKITLPEFREALISALQDPVVGIEGSTDRLSKTFEGSVSNMRDSLTRLSVSTGDALKDFFQMDKVVAAIGKRASEMAKEISLADDPVKSLSERLKALGLENENVNKAIKELETLELSESIIEEDKEIANLAERLSILRSDLLGVSDLFEKSSKNLNIMGTTTKLTNVELKQSTDNFQSLSEVIDTAIEKQTALINLADTEGLKRLVPDLERLLELRALLQADSTVIETRMEGLTGEIPQVEVELLPDMPVGDPFAEFFQRRAEQAKEEQQAFKDDLQAFKDRANEVEDFAIDNLGFVNEMIEDQVGLFEESTTALHELGKAIAEGDMARADEHIKEAAQGFKQFGDNIALALLNGQNLGDAVVNSIKAIAAELIAQQAALSLMKLFFPQATAAKAGFDLLGNVGKFFGFHQGGLIGGNANNVPIVAQSGEFVMQRSAVQSIGLDNLSAMNETGQANNVTINIHGGVVQEDYVRNELIPAINRSGARVA